MKLTPLDIKKQEFTRAFRGVDPQEVQSFLQMVADQWSSLLDENARMEQKVRDLDSKLEHYRKIEEALQEALETARDNSHKTIENAQREAQIIIREARGEAEELRKKGAQEHKRLKHDISKISGRRDEVIARLRGFLMSEMELLARFEGQDQLGASYVRLHPSEQKQLEPRTYVDDYDDNDLGFHAPLTRSTVVEEPSYEVDIPLDEIDSSIREKAEDLGSSSDNQIKMPYVRDDQDSEITLSDLSGKGKEPSQPEVTNDMDFIKSTVNTPRPSDRAGDFFKSPPEKKNGHTSPNASKGYSLNDRFSQEQKANTNQTDYNRSPSPSSGNLNQQSTNDGWVVRPVADDSKDKGVSDSSSIGNKGFASIFGNDPDDDLSATPEEIEKIRRILNDLD